jgi:hypothetical protein
MTSRELHSPRSRQKKKGDRLVTLSLIEPPKRICVAQAFVRTTLTVADTS